MTTIESHAATAYLVTGAGGSVQAASGEAAAAELPAGVQSPVIPGRAELPLFPRFPSEVLPALALMWAVMLALLLAVDDYFLVVALIATPTIAMLWPVGRALGRRYLSYRTAPWITGIATMWIILAAGLVLTETGWSFNTKSAVFFALPPVIGFGGVLVSLPWAQARPPVRMFFRPDLLFGDGRTLVGGTLMLVLGMRYLFAGHPPGVDWALPAWSWYSLAFGIAVGIIPIVLMRGMLKLVQRHMRLRDGLFTGYPSIAFREMLLVLLGLNFGFAFHHIFIGRTVFDTIGETGAFPITGQFWLGVGLIAAAVIWLVAVKGRVKRWIGEPFFFETIQQTLLKQTAFVIAWAVLFYGYMSVLNGEAFGKFKTWDDQAYAGLGFLLAGIAVLIAGRAVAQHYQREGMLAHWMSVILPTQPERARERIMSRVMVGIAGLDRRRQQKTWTAILRLWDELDPGERSVMIHTVVNELAGLPMEMRQEMCMPLALGMADLAPDAWATVISDIEPAVQKLREDVAPGAAAGFAPISQDGAGRIE